MKTYKQFLTEAQKTIKMLRVYHGTTPENAKKIKEKGFNQSEHGTYGPGVYSSTSKNVARRYARDSGSGVGREADKGIVSSRIYSGNVKNVRQQHDSDRTEAEKKSKGLISSGAKAVRVKNAATGHDTAIPGGGYEKEADYVISSPSATKPVKNDITIRRSSPTREIVTHRKMGHASGLDDYMKHEHPGSVHDRRPYKISPRKS
jgi:hypothetical protein